MTDDTELTVYDILGEEGFTGLVAAFYRRVPGDEVLGPMYPPHDLAGAERRLRDFLVFRFGGPPRYIAERGHPALRMRHAPFAVTPASRDRWFERPLTVRANRDGVEAFGRYLSIDVPAGADGQPWSFTRFAPHQVWFANAPNYLAASPEALVLPREVVGEAPRP